MFRECMQTQWHLQLEKMYIWTQSCQQLPTIVKEKEAAPPLFPGAGQHMQPKSDLDIYNHGCRLFVCDYLRSILCIQYLHCPEQGYHSLAETLAKWFFAVTRLDKCQQPTNKYSVMYVHVPATLTALSYLDSVVLKLLYIAHIPCSEDVDPPEKCSGRKHIRAAVLSQKVTLPV